ncbi:MAG: FAD-binding oxidoreductase [Chitinophagaceae bacterium]|nr:FAD-binding oxidoreductase [Chitinophagaceae bacterium]
MKKQIANWGNYPRIESDETTVTLLDELRDYVKNNDSFIARGYGRCYGDASLAPKTLCTLPYNRALYFDTEKGIFECQSGMTLDRILDIIVPKGWFLPVTPGTKFITVGGAVASDVHGKNHHVDGSFSAQVVDMDVVTHNGELFTCSPDNNSDLFWATCGGMGLTGVISRVKFRLKKIETAYIKQKQLKAENLTEIIRLFEENKHYTYSVAWIDCLKKGKGFGRSILMLGEHATLADLPASKKNKPLELPKRKQITFPFNLPSFVLNKLTVKAFNFLFYHKNLKKEINNVIPYEPFFYPLDAVHLWNRGYGKKGFIQYQFVIPLASKDGLIKILHRISDKGIGSFLAVLKVFGHQDDLISFPREGYTLALDIPVRDGLMPFLDELDELVLAYGGRLYMSKDARMKPSVLEKSYERLDEFRSVVNKYNPGYRFRSLQSDRLHLTSN